MTAGQETPKELRTVDLYKAGRSTKKLIVRKALNTEDMDQERFLTKIRQRMDRYAAASDKACPAVSDLSNATLDPCQLFVSLCVPRPTTAMHKHKHRDISAEGNACNVKHGAVHVDQIHCKSLAID